LDYANIGNVKYDSLKILDLREGATTEGEVKAAFQAMSRVWHPEKNN
jgi:DnaJ-class molecular chaperone